MISRLGLAVSRLFRRTAPDPFVLAVLLTVVTVVLALLLTPAGVGEAIGYWSGLADGPGDADAAPSGVWTLLAFGMQMCLILVTGHALASSPPMERALGALSALPRTPAQAVALVALVACVLGVLNWGLGLIGGALVARRVGVAAEARGLRVHYPLLAAAGYAGLLVWHGGLSGSAPISMTTGAQIARVFGADSGHEPVALTQTIFSPLNLGVTGGLLVLAPVLLAAMSPKREEDIEPASRFGATEARGRIEPEPDKPFLPRLLEDTPIVTILLAAMLGWWGWAYYRPGGGHGGIAALTPDSVNLTMLLAGLVLHGTPRRYVRAVEEAARGCAGIILQFPLYAGIMGLMKESGLTALMADAIASAGGERSLPLLTFVSAGVVNLLVPSGGGQWAIQGPIALEAAQSAGVPAAKMVMAVAYGDELTNMLQPFWALPLLAITGVRARDMVGYTAVLMIAAGGWMALGLALL
jgi:short-chain fatty acids transporter